MKHVYEFEVFLDEGRYTVWPFDFECGGTSGATFREACEMAVDWLKTVVEDYAMHDEATPEPTFDNEPRYGGRIITVAIDAGLETIPRMTAAEAARALGVSPSRVSHMIRDGLLESFKYGHNTWVTGYSVEARLRERPRAGRPKRKPAASAEAGRRRSKPSRPVPRTPPPKPRREPHRGSLLHSQTLDGSCRKRASSLPRAQPGRLPPASSSRRPVPARNLPARWSTTPSRA